MSRANSTTPSARATPGRICERWRPPLRAFALRDPHGFDLLFTPPPVDAAPNTSTLAAAAGPVLRIATKLAGHTDALDAARTLTAWASGFLRMELSGAFQLGGDVSRAFEFGLQTLTNGLEHRET